VAPRQTKRGSRGDDDDSYLHPLQTDSDRKADRTVKFQHTLNKEQPKGTLKHIGGDSHKTRQEFFHPRVRECPSSRSLREWSDAKGGFDWNRSRENLSWNGGGGTGAEQRFEKTRGRVKSPKWG
jgi:hypothetical protein